MLTIGSVFAGAGVLLAALLALVFRHPRAPRWTRPELLVYLTMVPVAGMIGLGFGYALYGGIALLQGEGDVRELWALVVVPAAVALIWYALGIGRRLRAYAAATAAESADADPAGVRLAGASEEPPEAPAPDPPPRRPTRKAA